ncbi:M50 family metallopeptidase [Microbacterium sp.]|uniref:M50 family metallopeptidase n=1 Tax=Microbacterium sp. TaxID=51671 RepID=UPI003F9EA39A
MTGVEFALGIVALAVFLLISIALHELGHFVFARRFGVPVRQFMVGFGPTLWSRRARGTEFGIKLLPLGGYITMKGMYPDADDVYSAVPTGGTAFYRLTAPKKVVIMAAGPVVNLVIAVVLMLVAFWGMGATVITVGSITECTPSSSSDQCTAEDSPSPASLTLREGDVLVAIDGRPISQWDQAVDIIHSRPDQATTFTVIRDGERLERQVTLASVDADGTPIGYLGVAPGTALQPQSFVEASGQMLTTVGSTVTTLAKLPVSAATTVSNMFAGADAQPDRPLSLVGAGHLAGVISSSDVIPGPLKVRSLVLLGAQLNLILFLINMIPLPPFDGGHIAVSVYQAVRDRIASRRGNAVAPPVSIARLMPVTLTTLAVLVSISVVFIVADIIAPVL